MRRTQPLSSIQGRRVALLAIICMLASFLIFFGFFSLRSAQADTGDTLRGTVVGQLDLYAQPDVSSDIVTSLSSGFAFQAVDVGDGWYAASYSVDGQAIPVYFSDLSSIALYDAPNSDVLHGAIVGGDLSVYLAPSLDSQVIATYTWGTTIQFCRFNDAYYMARIADGTLGYIPAQSVLLYDPQESGVLVRYAGTEGVNVYQAPDMDSPVLTSFEAGQKLQFADFSADWLMARMTVDGASRTVFVPKSSVSVDAPSSQEVITPENHTEQVGASTINYQGYGITLSQLTQVENSGTWIIWDSSQDGNWGTATSDDLRHYLNPANFEVGSAGFFQFLRLDIPTGISVEALNEKLASCGVLAGHGSAFSEACSTYSINEAYLVSHARLETGNGTSQLAKGVWYDPESDAVYTSEKEASTHTQATLVYNVYGIGAYDSAPLYGGAKRAYQEGWTSVDAAIIGGAQFIGSTYFSAGSVTLSGQNTLYKMLFHPEQAVINASSDGEKPWHEYATDVAWASKQAVLISQFYDDISSYSLTFEVPVYAGN